MKEPIGYLIFVIIWLLFIIVGLIRPKTYFSLINWGMKAMGKMYGFEVKPKSDEVLSKRIRIWYSIFLIFGLLILYQAIKAVF